MHVKRPHMETFPTPTQAKDELVHYTQDLVPTRYHKPNILSGGTQDLLTSHAQNAVRNSKVCGRHVRRFTNNVHQYVISTFNTLSMVQQ